MTTWPPPFDYAAMAGAKTPRGWDPTHPHGCWMDERPLVYHPAVWWFTTLKEAREKADTLGYSVLGFDIERGQWRVEEFFNFYG